MTYKSIRDHDFSWSVIVIRMTKSSAQGIKVTQGITGWSWVGVRILPALRHLDVGSSLPGVVSDAKGAAVLRVMGNVSWVHTVVTQVGFYLLRVK